MNNIQLMQIITDKLIDLKVGESKHIIIPINNQEINIHDRDTNWHSAKCFECPWCKGKDPYCPDCYGTGKIWDIDCESKDEFISKYSLMQQGDKFYIGEKFNDGATDTSIISANQIMPDQSRFHGECLSVDIIRVGDLQAIQLGCKDSNKGRAKYKKIISQYNKLHNTNITTSMENYVFLIEARRTK